MLSIYKTMLFILLVVMSTAVECVDRSKLGSTPPPHRNFDIDKYMGDWYVQARLPPCSWAGSQDFTNYVTQYNKQTTGDVILRDTWRSADYCTSALLRLTPNGQPGVLKTRDTIGNVLSGIQIIIATDYKKFAIKWGCTKYDVDGSCSDTYIVVKTRQRDPSPHTWKVIQAILDHYWKLDLSEMVRVVHDKDGCVQFKTAVDNYHRSYGVEHLSKTY